MAINRNLYNKYRPKSFSEVIGQEVSKKLLLKTFTNNKLLQSFIFYGSQGTGKTSVARIFAKAWNCEKFSELGDVCNECKNCKLINDNSTIDICEMDSASNSGVDHVRELIQNSQYMPIDLHKKVYLIDECHNLSNSAWNALLKTIEEPSSDKVIFIFLTTNISKVPETILSRCQKYNFSNLSEEELNDVVKSVEEGEGRQFDDDAKNLLIHLSQGSARECISLVEQVFLSTEEPRINLKDVENIFALANKEDQIYFLELLSNDKALENRRKLIQIVENMVSENRNLLNYFSSLLVIAMDVYIYEMTEDLSLLKRINESDVKRLANNGINYLSVCDILFRELKVFSSACSKGDWARLIVLKLLSSYTLEKKEKPREEKVVSELAAPAAPKPAKPTPTPESKEEDNLRVPKEVELKFLYNTLEDRRDISRSQKNYEIYKSLKSKEDLSPELQEVLFQNSIVFPDRKMITTDRTVLLLFKDRQESDRFNKLVFQGSRFEKELNEMFMGDYFWWSATLDQMKFYRQQPKPSSDEIIESFNSEKENEEFKKLVDILSPKK